MKNSRVIHDQVTSLEKSHEGHLIAQILVKRGFIFPSLVVFTVIEGGKVVCEKIYDYKSVCAVASGRVIGCVVSEARYHSCIERVCSGIVSLTLCRVGAREKDSRSHRQRYVLQRTKDRVERRLRLPRHIGMNHLTICTWFRHHRC